MRWSPAPLAALALVALAAASIHASGAGPSSSGGESLAYVASGVGAVTSVDHQSGRIAGDAAGGAPITIATDKPFNVVGVFTMDDASERAPIVMCIASGNACLTKHANLDMGFGSAAMRAPDTTLPWPAGTTVYVWVLNAATDAARVPTMGSAGTMLVAWQLSNAGSA